LTIEGLLCGNFSPQLHGRSASPGHPGWYTPQLERQPRESESKRLDLERYYDCLGDLIQYRADVAAGSPVKDTTGLDIRSSSADDAQCRTVRSNIRYPEVLLEGGAFRSIAFERGSHSKRAGGTK
jgi:hypothetical protein